MIELLTSSGLFLLAVTLTIAGLAGWIINLLGMPGNWLIVVIAAGCWWLVDPAEHMGVSSTALAIIVAAAVIGELLEFAASALGASRMGGSKRGTFLALGGSVLGAVLGLVFGNAIPIPIVGPLLASLLLGAAGAFVGAISGERWAGKDWDASIQIGSAAFWGRLLGTVSKAACGTLAAGVLVFAIWF